MQRSFDPMNIVITLLIAYVAICAFMFFYQRHLMYMPMRNIQAPSEYGLSNAKALSLNAVDGTTLQAWYIPARGNYPTILHYHGNGGHLGHRADFFKLLSAAGFGVLAVDYRGYGASEGSPNERGFYLDGEALVTYAKGALKLPPQKIILYGESIGTAVAIEMAVTHEAAALILQSPFTSATALGQASYPWLPVSWLLKDKYDNISKIGQLKTPLLIIHGEKDTIVPITYGKALFERAPEPKTSVYFPDIGHNDFAWEMLANETITFSRAQKLIK